MDAPLYERQVGCCAGLMFWTKVVLKMTHVGQYNFETAQKEVARDEWLDNFVAKVNRLQHIQDRKTGKIA